MNMTLILPLVAIGLVILIVAIVLIIIGISNKNEEDPLSERLALYSSGDEATANLEEIEMQVPFTQRVLLPIAQKLAEFTTSFAPQQTLEKTQRLIVLAGKPNGLTPALFWVSRFVMLFVLSFLLLAVFSIANRPPIWRIAGFFGGGAFGFFMPWMLLRSKVKRRQDAIIKALPDALDLMSICVEAGLGFDQAMGKVFEKWENELALSFGRVIKEISLGKTRRDALKNMAESMDVPDVTTFTGAIIQADQLGVSISKVLKIQSEQMRIKRRQRAQEKAQQAPVKMMIPMVLLIFPVIWLVLLGPAAVQLFKQFYGG